MNSIDDVGFDRCLKVDAFWFSGELLILLDNRVKPYFERRLLLLLDDVENLGVATMSLHELKEILVAKLQSQVAGIAAKVIPCLKVELSSGAFFSEAIGNIEEDFEHFVVILEHNHV